MDSPAANKTYDVIIIGGGATGAGIARDCSRRGLRTLLLERNDIAMGATGRNHGLLHSGGRYAVTDPESASECITENIILKKIARHCIEPTDGLFITLPEDDPSFQSKFVEACKGAGIPYEIIDPHEAVRMEPSVNPNLIGAVKLPDGAVDPFRLTLANITDAKNHGADILTYHEVTGLVRSGTNITGVEVFDHTTKQSRKIYGEITVNAAGIWGQRISAFAGVKINMLPAKGSLLIFGHRINNMVINRCRVPSDADILVPGDTISLIGTTSGNIPYEEIDRLEVTREEVDELLKEGQKLSPALAYTRILRAYAGVRPLVMMSDDTSGRDISRGIVLFDHEQRDGLGNYITITGGKLMTYRLMAEKATDMICGKLNIDKKCDTALVNLPGSDGMAATSAKIVNIPLLQRESAKSRYGSLAGEVIGSENDNSLVCECEQVSKAEIKYAIKNLNVTNLVDLRRRTRLGMGSCQGELCACRAAAIMVETGAMTPEESRQDLAGFINERWKGIKPVAWGEALRETVYTEWIHRELYGLTAKAADKKAHNDEI